MLKKSASGVLASLRGSTYRMRISEVGSTRGVYPFAKIHCKGNGHTKCGLYLLASSLAAALLDGLFESILCDVLLLS
jgi:hypothetical protein